MTSIQIQGEHRTPPVYSYASKEGLESDGSTSDHEPDEYTSLLAASAPPATGNLGNRSVSSLLDSDVRSTLKPKAKSTCLGRWCEPRWRSIYIMYFTMFLSAVTFSIVLSSIWPYLLQVDQVNATPFFLGWVIASYSFGQLVASPLFGFWADKRPTREPLLVAIVINVVFSLLYCYCGAIPSGVSGYIIIVSRAMVGFGAAVAAIVRSYVSEATTEKERTGAMAGVSSAQALGFILGPALGLAFVPLGSTGFVIEPIRFHFNVYTGPGYLSALMGVINVVLLFFFKEVKLSSTRDKKMRDRKVSPDHTLPLVTQRKYFDRCAAGTMIVLFFVVLFAFAVLETIAAPMSMDEFAWGKQQAILYNNAFFAGLAVLAIATFICIKFITKCVDERVVLMVSLFLMAIGYFVLLPMGDTLPKVAISWLDSPISTNSSVPWDNDNNLTHLEGVGCRDPPQSWCTYISQIYLVQYILALMLLAIGYPAGNLISYAIFSKILGPFPQGTMMGILTAAGSLARALGPMCVTALYQHFGPTVTFSSVVGLMAAAILLLLFTSYRLKPYSSNS
ncbi:major facilitator superfamily domain-containing protein 8-like isoform X2 [Halichondria panicea]|uniref:major facilitator superfamily domain-containing protein 8-like isoform X2 n=1 Tax=Halichondria panicea TaxID=6063 RepID=UPI00312B6A04